MSSPVAIEWTILETLLTALGVNEAAKPYLDTIAKMNADGATGEQILEAVRNMRVAAEADAQKSINAA